MKTFTGYVDCACRDCFEIAIGVEGQALCHDCEAAGCEAGNGECRAPGAYGVELELAEDVRFFDEEASQRAIEESAIESNYAEDC